MLIARQRRPGRATLQHVVGRWARSVKSKRARRTRLRVRAGEVAWLAGHRDASLTLSATAITASGAVDESEERVKRH